MSTGPFRGIEPPPSSHTSITELIETERSIAIRNIDEAIFFEGERGRFIKTLKKVKKIFANAINTYQMNETLILLRQAEKTIIREE